MPVMPTGWGWPGEIWKNVHVDYIPPENWSLFGGWTALHSHHISLGKNSLYKQIFQCSYKIV